MKHLIINIEIAVDEGREPLMEYEAKEAAKQAYKAARKALPQFTIYDEQGFTYKIEQ